MSCATQEPKATIRLKSYPEAKPLLAERRKPSGPDVFATAGFIPAGR